MSSTFKSQNFGTHLGRELKNYEDPENMVNISVQGGHEFCLPKIFIVLHSKLFQRILHDIFDIVTDIIIDIDPRTFELYCDFVTDGIAACQSEEEFWNLEEFLSEMLDIDENDQATEKAKSIFSSVPVDENDKVTCGYCFKMFCSIQRCNGHKEICDKNPNKKLPCFECDICQHVCKTKEGLRSHIEDKHRNPLGTIFTCQECPSKFKNKSSLRRHCSTKHDIFPNDQATPEETLEKRKCSVCKLLIKKSHYNNHLKKHQKASKKHKCSQCKYETDRYDNLVRHKKTHNITAKNINVSKIQKSMDNNSDLTFQCKDCNKKFKSSKDVVKHIKQKSCDELKCKICKQEFTLKANVKKHIKKYHS